MLRVQPLLGRTNRSVANQYIIVMPGTGQYFQSYNSIIAFKPEGEGKIALDRNYWDYSTTTSKYLAQFLGIASAEVRKRVKKGEYLMADLN